MRRRTANQLISAATAALALWLPAAALAAGHELGTITSTSTSAAGVTTSAATTTSASASETQSSTRSSTTSPQSSTSTTTTQSTSPEVREQGSQPQTGSGENGGQTGSGVKRGHAGHRGSKTSPGAAKTPSANKVQGAKKPPTSSALLPGQAGRNGLAPLPFSLRTPVSGLPSLFLEAYDVPPFLLPIYQAAGIAYGVPWQVLAAINEVESDYGRDLNISSAGAEGWMQFLPSEWRQWGVDAGGAGYMDPYNPADAIFAAARYLSAAGGAAHIRAAVFAYNHSQAYVESVMLRAQLLGGMPPEMLGAVTDLAEARFPVHAPAHFSDAFSAAPHGAGRFAGKTIVGTTIYSEPGAPVVAVKDGTVVAIGDSPALGLHVSLRDAYGDVFTYADLGEVASVYPVLEPRVQPGGVRVRIAQRSAAPPPSGPATAGVQSHPPLSLAAVASGFAFGVAEGLQRAPSRLSHSSSTAVSGSRRGMPRVRAFREGPERVLLRTLRPGAEVIAGTVLGHLGGSAGAHMLFQIRPGGEESPLIDPKPLLDSWVALEETGVFGAKGEDPFLSVSPTAGQALLESRGELQQQVLRNRAISLPMCSRREVEAGRIDRRVLATLELLSVSGLRPTVSHLRCGGERVDHAGLDGYAGGAAVDISAIDGVPIAGHDNPGGVADLLERKLLALQGTMKPMQVAGPATYLATREAVTLPSSKAIVHLAFDPIKPGAPTASARLASAGSALFGSEWTALDERLAEISDPGVSQTRSTAAVPDATGASSQEGGG
jgi:murein DD-endopeptidase MepM/ murein hydrolase activator NlpD